MLKYVSVLFYALRQINLAMSDLFLGMDFFFFPVEFLLFTFIITITFPKTLKAQLVKCFQVWHAKRWFISPSQVADCDGVYRAGFC